MRSLLAPLKAAFPVPEYLAMRGAGIDISGNSIKTVMLKPRGTGTGLAAYRTVPLPAGAITHSEIEKPDALVEMLRTLRLKERIHAAHASLSERKAYLYEQLVPAGTSDLKGAVEFELEEHVPVSPAELIFDFERVRTVDAGTIVAVTAYARRIVESYEAVFQKAGIVLRSLEVESQAVARTLATPAARASTVLVVDFGRATTRIVILDHGIAAFTATLDVGGDALATAIMKAKSVSADEAEKIKNEQGFLEGPKNREIYESLLSTISVLKDEVAKHLSFWNATESAVPRLPVERLIMIGGNANVKGLPEYLARALGLPVAIGNVWANAFSLDEYVPAMPAHESLEYAAAIGLALRSTPSAPW